jgi:DNA-binding transcriptional ArsR family regulator
MDQKATEICQYRVIHQERIDKAGATALEEGEVETLSQLFKAMGDPSRLKILWALAQGEMCVCDLAAFLGITESAVSHQLRNLRQLQLVANRREGVVLYYRLADQHVSELLSVALQHVRE